jgi:hypothetical protein
MNPDTNTSHGAGTHARVPDQRRSVWMVERQAYGGRYWEKVTFGPFATKEEAERFTHSPFGGYVYDASAPIVPEPEVALGLRARSNVLGSES